MVGFPSSESPNLPRGSNIFKGGVCHVSFSGRVPIGSMGGLYIYQHWKLMRMVNAGEKTHHVWHGSYRVSSWERWQENIKTKTWLVNLWHDPAITLPETNGKNTWKWMVGKPYFQGQTVSFREGKWLQSSIDIYGHLSPSWQINLETYNVHM